MRKPGYLIEAKWPMYPSVTSAIINSDNALSPGRHQVINWTNSGMVFIGPLGTNLSNYNRNSYIFIKENTFENVYKMKAFLSRSQYIIFVSAITSNTKLACFYDVDSFDDAHMY